MTYFLAVSAWAEGHHHEHHAPPKGKAKVASPQLQGKSLYHLLGKWKTAAGEAFPLQKLRGRPVILTMAYTHCTTTCPATVAKLKEIESALKAAGEDQATIVLASFDPKRDTPERLAAYALERKLDAKRWLLLSPEGDRDVRELAAALGIVYSRDKDGEFSHSNVISLLDREGVFQTQVAGLVESHSELVQLVVKAKSGR